MNNESKVEKFKEIISQSIALKRQSRKLIQDFCSEVDNEVLDQYLVTMYNLSSVTESNAHTFTDGIPEEDLKLLSEIGFTTLTFEDDDRVMVLW